MTLSLLNQVLELASKRPTRFCESNARERRLLPETMACTCGILLAERVKFTHPTSNLVEHTPRLICNATDTQTMKFVSWLALSLAVPMTVVASTAIYSPSQIKPPPVAREF